MKKNYFLFFVAFGINFLMAQSCPPNALNVGDQVFFVDSSNSLNCFEMPNTITIEGSTYSGIQCDTNSAIYELDMGGTEASDLDVFDVDFGGGLICSYNNGTLPIKDFEFLYKKLKLYPNPLNKGNSINLSFGLPEGTEVSIYNVMGKLISRQHISGHNLKEIKTSNLLEGIYLIRISTEGVSFNRRIAVVQ
ncbi:T9SS type A sorting domain-containing protein [Seonamhaeicola aphaedonensis]|uniref:Putative secreted protein (Por secretion system target) n=1 Tax=Seonamhaeicola aphaedonensis TaxID=1461338 RepID=A0A3D9H944_9FLAO|nr:T9SS type A sorting domain-containing protein [Seonamhaeicola aphaedonensis]RED45999.1 putative secreted protein (Por secretion system target) [Seonamhaeicola aphaedonensis]